MCGIAGVVHGDGAPVERQTLCSMIGLMRHRGPDAQVVRTLGAAGLAHARLSIIDLAGGAQPMASDDNRYCLTFNGEIYNYIEVRAELAKLGHTFRTTSDTEVILHAYAEYGADCVTHFNGQFAFAIWDAQARELFIARDRLGKKPFYYAQAGSTFVFGSECKAILAHPSVPRDLDLKGLSQILSFWCTTPPRTVFAAIRELPPGHRGVVREGRLRLSSYWSLEYQEPDERRSAADYADELRALLIDAVRLRMLRSDVPVGAYLSGGLDSTVITGMVTRYTDVPLKTFSVAFEDPEFDERSFQQQTVDFLGVRDHHQVVCRAEDIGRAFPDVIWHSEQPIVRTAPTPLFLLSRLVREQGYKVVLTGEGSDEMLGGYDIFKEAKIRRFWASQPQSRWRPLLLKKLYPYMPAMQSQSPAYLQAFFHVKPEQLESPFFSHLPRWGLTAQAKRFLSADVQAALNGYQPESELEATLPPAFPAWSPFAQAQYLEASGLLPGYILSSQGDRVQMANSVEGRCPFLDYRIAELAGRIPASMKMRGLDEKFVLKLATRDLVPPAVQDRPKQPYRSMEVPSFFDVKTKRARFDYVDEFLSPACLRQTGLFDPDAVARLVDKARSGGVIGLKDSMALVSTLSAQLVAAQFVSRLGRLSE